MNAGRKLRERMKAHQESELHGHRLGPYIQDIVYGGIDGIVTTFAVVAATAGADMHHFIVVIVGLANLFADAASMAVGAFLSLRSESDQHNRLRKEELKEIEEIPDIEREEIREFYEKKGFTGNDLERAVQIITSNKEIWADTMMLEEHGVSKGSTDKPALHGGITYGSFVLFGCIPLIPYLIQLDRDARFTVAIISTFVALGLLGLTRSIVTRENLLRGPLEIMILGILVTIFAYAIGVWLKGLTAGML